MIRRPVITLVVAALLGLASLFAVSRLRIDTSLSALFNPRDPAVAALDRVMNNFHSVEELLILAESDSVDSEQLLSFADRLNTAIKTDPVATMMSPGAVYRVDEQQRKFFEQVVVPSGLFYLDGAAYNAAKRRLTRDEMAAQLKRDQTLIATPGPASTALSKVLLKDPLRLHEFMLDQIASARPFQTYQNSDAFLAPDGKALLIRVPGNRPVNDIEFAKQFTARIKSLADRVNTDHLQLGLAGAYAIATVSEQAIRADMIASVVTSVVCLQLLFIVSYRHPIRTFLLAFTPVALGVSLGFGAYALLSDRLSPMTAVIGGVLAGLAIDYAIAFLSAYNTNPSLDSARRSIAPAILAGCVTSVVGFAAIGFSDVRALRDFSLLGALGLVGAWAAALTVLPALLAILDRNRWTRTTAAAHRWSIEPLLHQLLRRPKQLAIVMGLVLLVALMIVASPGTILPLESDLSVMHPRPNSALDAQDRIAQRMGMSPGTLIVYLNADSSEALLDLAHALHRRLRPLMTGDSPITGGFGLHSLLPDPTIIPTRLKDSGPTVAARVIADFKSAATDSIFDPAAFEPYIGFLNHLLTATTAPTITDLRRYPSLSQTILSTDPGAHEAITLLFLRDDLKNRETRDRAITDVRNALVEFPGATLTGLGVLNYDTEQSIRRDLPRLVIAAAVIVALYLLVHFRNLTDSALAMLPAIFGIGLLLAFMRLTGQKLNMVNLIAFPLLIGMDVDYGIFLVSAARRMKEVSRLDALAPACWTVIHCAATTLLGFGSLAFTSVPAVQSLGVTVTVGILACLAGSLFMVVPILLWRAR